MPFGEFSVHTCGPWCQGPVLAQMLRLVEATGCHKHAHNSFDYVHTLTEIMKLSFADRHAYYGDPNFMDVPLARLLSPSYAAERASLIRADKAWPDMPPPGLERDRAKDARAPRATSPQPQLDTSYVCAVDRHGNVFSATPSDVSTDTPIIPGTGLAVSSRGSQSWLVPEHPSAVAPGKRPRLTPNPAMLVRDGRAVMPFGTPGGDVQCQAMLQVLLNILVFDMSPQRAVEAARVATQSFPDSFWPHRYFPGRLSLEARIPESTAAELADRGHEVARWSEWEWRAGAVCLVRVDESGVRWGAADPRRDSYAVAW